MRTKLLDLDWNLWLWWVIGTSAASTAGLVLMILIVSRLNLPFFAVEAGSESPSIGQQLALAPLFILPGAALGLGQWTIMRSLVPRAGRWIAATALSWPLAYAILSFVPTSAYSSLPAAMAVLAPWAFIGLAGGAGQWLILRSYFHGAGWWIPTSAFAVMVGSAGWLFAGLCGGFLAWVGAGAITGLLLLAMTAPEASFR